MGKMAYHLDPKGSFETLLSDWRPKPEDKRRSEPASEKEYERSLVDYLRDNLEGMQVIPQAGKGLQRGDIVVLRKSLLGGKYEDVVELKMGLKSAATHQRLIGQIESYEPGRHGWVFVVVCGDDVDPKYINDLKLKYKGKESVGIFHKRCKKGVSRIV